MSVDKKLPICIWRTKIQDILSSYIERTHLAPQVSYLYRCIRHRHWSCSRTLEGNYSYIIYYINKNISPTKLNYTVTENDFLVVIHVINNFWHYIIGYWIVLHTYHCWYYEYHKQTFTPKNYKRKKYTPKESHCIKLE